MGAFAAPNGARNLMNVQAPLPHPVGAHVHFALDTLGGAREPSHEGCLDLFVEVSNR